MLLSGEEMLHVMRHFGVLGAKPTSATKTARSAAPPGMSPQSKMPKPGGLDPTGPPGASSVQSRTTPLRDASPERSRQASQAASPERSRQASQAASPERSRQASQAASPQRSRQASQAASPQRSRRSSEANMGGLYVSDAPLPESKPVEMTLKLALDFRDAGEKGSPQRVAFDNNLTQDLANASGLPPHLFEVVRVSAGSIIVDTLIHPDPANRDLHPMKVATELEKQAGQPNSPLLSGVLTRRCEGIALPTVRPGSMDKLLPPQQPPPAPKSAPKSPENFTRSTPAVPASKTAADDAQLAALKAKLNRYKRELDQAPPAALPPPVSPSRAPVPPRSPELPPKPIQLITPPRVQGPPPVFTPPIATMLEDAVMPASTVPVYEQKTQSVELATLKPASNHASFYNVTPNTRTLPLPSMQAQREQELAALDTRMSNVMGYQGPGNGTNSQK
jgi:hypothetical protein